MSEARSMAAVSDLARYALAYLLEVERAASAGEIARAFNGRADRAGVASQRTVWMALEHLRRVDGRVQKTRGSYVVPIEERPIRRRVNVMFERKEAV